MSEHKCPHLSSEDKNATINFMKKSIKSKEEELRRKQEELESTPTRYKVRKTIEEEVNDLDVEIKSIKDLAKKIEQI